MAGVVAGGGDTVQVLPHIAIAPLEAVRVEIPFRQQLAELVTVQTHRQALHVTKDELIGYRRETTRETGKVVRVAGIASVAHDMWQVADHQIIVVWLGVQKTRVRQHPVTAFDLGNQTVAHHLCETRTTGGPFRQQRLRFWISSKVLFRQVHHFAATGGGQVHDDSLRHLRRYGHRSLHEFEAAPAE